MTSRRGLSGCLVLLGVLSGGFASAVDESPIPKWGKEIFLQHCAACHGADGRGAGPAAATLKTGPSDLTQISRAHDGKFPFLKVVGFIDGETPVPAHGSFEMPVWGRIFRWKTGDYGARSQIYALAQYIESIQEK
jgi:mono/diheme cytochrome c family protein